MSWSFMIRELMVFHAKLRSAEVLLQENGQARLIRRAEKPEDYLATLYGFDIEK